ncbi:MAG TPA: DUF1643 domain-containing protein [Candidatus Dorea intestinavium]|nr:DUF1643 domain-containing protein [Candidatus Dorea intestinavium]
MIDKVTKRTVKYPEGKFPDIIYPPEYEPFRYAIGKKGKNPFVAIGMNPSAAREETSDRTINRIIHIGEILGYDGWIAFNLYPERATKAANLDDYKEELASNNIRIIEKYLIENKITEIYGAWGDLHFETLKKGKEKVIELLKKLDIKVFYFGTLTKQGNPRHPIQRQEKWEISVANKKYIDF